jgi:hypothetical protein
VGSREGLYLISVSGYLCDKLENYFELQQISWGSNGFLQEKRNSYLGDVKGINA